MNARGSPPRSAADTSPPDPAQGSRGLVITGMHRSATSLVTSALASAGLAIGERLIEPGPGNLDGHFEDRDFVELHERILRGNGLGGEGYATPATIVVPAGLEAEARRLVDDRRRAGRAWGWKDPRTTLFLDFWRQRLPEAGFLLLVRRPWEVVDSLYRRGDEPFRLHPAFAIDVWTAYNRRIRDFFLANRDRCLLVDSARAVDDCAGLVAVVRERLGIPLGEAMVVARPERFRRDPGCRHRDLLAALRPEAVDLFEELLGLSWRQDEPAAPPADATRGLEVAMAEWARAARSEAAAMDLGRRLAEAHADLEKLRAKPSVRSIALPSPAADQPGSLPLVRRLFRESRRLCRQARSAMRGLHPRPRSIDPPDSARAA